MGNEVRAWTYRLLFAFIFTIPWETALVWGLGTLSRTMGLAVAALWMFAVLQSRRFPRLGYFHVLAAAFFLWTASSVLWSLDVEVTVARSISTLQMIVLLIILWDLLRTADAVRAGLQAYVLGAYVVVGVLVATYLRDPEILRYQALKGNANDTAVVLALGTPLAWYLAASSLRSFWDLVARILNYVYLPLALFGIALTATRFAMIMAVPGMLFGVATMGKVRMTWRVAILMAVGVMLVWSPTVVPERSLERLLTAGEEIGSGDLNKRTIFWREAVEVWQERPWTGVGAAAFASVSRSGRSAHNSFFSILAELGSVGLVLYCLLWSAAVFMAWSQPVWESRFWLTMIVVLLLANSALTMANTKGSWLFFGLLAASWGVFLEQREEKRDSSAEPSAALGLGLQRSR